MNARRTAPRRKPPGRLLRAFASADGDRGQATVEVVALLPLVALLVLAMAQGAVAGWSAWSAGGAARVAARASALDQDPQRAARRALPALLARTARVGTDDDADRPAISVRLHIPSVLPGVRLGTVRAEAGLPRQAP